MWKFRFMFVLIFIVAQVSSELPFTLHFLTWPNETQAVVNDTVKFLWKYYVKGIDVDIKWGTARQISPKVSTFDKIFFTAKKYKGNGAPVLSTQIPARYKGRVQIIGQASLQIINVTEEDEGGYLCEISDSGAGWKTLSRAVQLHVLTPPTIISHPRESQLLDEGEELKLGCKATGKPIPEVSWYKGHTELIQGIRSAEYLKTDVARGDNGIYRCVARNNASQVEYAVKVVVQYKPVGTKIKTDAKSDTLRKGEDLKIVCEAYSVPAPSFNLYHYSETGLKKEVKIVEKSTSGEFYIRSIKPNQRGNYSCVPYNDVGGGAEALVRVYVRFSPVITKLSPRKLNLTENEPLSISCDTEGYPLPRITWTKGNGKILGNERMFRIPHVDKSDQGIYTCVASNGILPIANKSVHIKVFYKPVIDKKRSSSLIAAQAGETILLKCNATGNPLPSFEWKKGDVTIGSNSIISVKMSSSTDFGWYSCYVYNSVDTTRHNVKVFKVVKPIIEEIKIASLESRSVHLTWKISSDSKNPIRKQELVYFLMESKEDKNRVEIEGKKQSFKLHGLTPYSQYVVRLKAQNDHLSSDGKEITFTTATARPGPPGQPRVQFRYSTSVRVTWSPPIEQNGELVGYHLEYSFANDSSTLRKIAVLASKTSVDIENLKRGILYKFKVRAETSAGKGDFSQSSSFQMNFQAPLIAESPNVTIPYVNVYRLLWKKTNLAGNLAKVFVALEWRIKHSRRVGQDEKEIDIGKNIRSRTRRDVRFNWKAEMKEYGSIRALDLIDLFPNTIYKVSIKEGLEVKGELIWSGETSAEIVTPEGVPSQPRDLTVDMQSDKSVLLFWKRPLYLGGKLTKYVVLYGVGNDKQKRELKNGLENINLTMVINGLTSRKKYDVQVQAYGNNPGLISDNLEFETDSGILKMSVESQTKDSFTITWSKPSNPTIKVDDYRIYYRTKNGKWKSRDITSGLDNETLSAKVNGLVSGELYQVKIVARSKRQVFLSKMHEVRSAIVEARKSDETDYIPMFGGIIAGVLIFAFVIIIVAMFVRYNYRKRQRNQRRDQGSHTTPNVLITRENGHTHMSSPSDHLSTDSPGSEKYLRPERKGNSVQVPQNVLSKSTKPIPVSNLLEYYTDHSKDGNKGFAEEFKSIDMGVNHSYEECKKPVNKSKNRYANIVAYDHTRVCLSGLGDNGSDYINANYIDGYNCAEKFIATQGPVASTFNDFWRMVWEQNCLQLSWLPILLKKER